MTKALVSATEFLEAEQNFIVGVQKTVYVLHVQFHLLYVHQVNKNVAALGLLFSTSMFAE